MTNLGQMDACLLTDKGQVRDRNEDFFAYLEPASPEEEKSHGWLYLVADGVGGADAGDVASRFAAERMLHHFVAAGAQPALPDRLEDAMQAANTDLRSMAASRTESARGMATTMVAAAIQEAEAVIGNVGDSRAYHYRAGTLRQITKDQSLVAKLVEEGAITPEQATRHRHKNVILYSLGSERQPQIDTFHLTLEAGDVLLLCSDGLVRHVADAEIERCLATAQDANAAAHQMLQLACERGGEDNISIAVIRYRPAEAGTRRLAAVPAAVVAQPEGARNGGSRSARTFLWLYTAFLCVFQSVIIVLLWFLLQT